MCQWWLFIENVAQEIIQIPRLTLNMYFDKTDTVSYPADQVMFAGKSIDERPKADTLYVSGQYYLFGQCCRIGVSFPL